jgi:hypothetical protein
MKKTIISYLVVIRDEGRELVQVKLIQSVYELLLSIFGGPNQGRQYQSSSQARFAA